MFPSPQKYQPDDTLAKKSPRKFKVPIQRRDANEETIKNDVVGPQSYDLLTGHGLIDVKAYELESKKGHPNFAASMASSIFNNTNMESIIKEPKDLIKTTYKIKGGNYFTGRIREND